MTPRRVLAQRGQTAIDRFTPAPQPAAYHTCPPTNPTATSNSFTCSRRIPINAGRSRRITVCLGGSC